VGVVKVETALDGLDSFIERKVVIGMITDDKFLGWVYKMCGEHKATLFSEGPAQHVASWIFKFWEQYHKAPNNAVDLRILFETGSRKIPDIDMRELIEGILDSLAEEYEVQPEEWEGGNLDLLRENAYKFLRMKALMQLSDKLGEIIQIRDIDESINLGEEVISQFRKLQSMGVEDVQSWDDKDAIRDSLERVEKPLFSLPGELGKIVNNQFVEGGFISLMGPEKRGKSYLLMEIALQACKQRVPAALVQAGDMDTWEMIQRIQVRLAKKSNRERYCGELAIPILDCAKNQRDECTLRQRTCLIGLVDGPNQNSKRNKKKNEDEDDMVNRLSPKDIVKRNPDYIPCSECRKDKNDEYEGAYFWTLRPPVDPLTADEAIKISQKVKATWKSDLRISSHPADSLSVSGLRQLLDEWDVYGNFRPKVVVLDYMDLLASERYAGKEFRHAQNEIWKQVRGLAQERKILIVTATQADAASYDKKTLTMANFSEDKRKYAHVTAMWGLNQTPLEKFYGLMRINQLVARGDYFSSRETVTILQSLQTGQPMISSFITR
jgi:hypothetical protein